MPSSFLLHPSSFSPRRALHSWEWRVIWLLILCCVCRDLPWRLDDLDQAKQGNVSLEIVGAGHWWFQHTPGGRAIATKPPLVGWLSAGICYLTAGNWDLAWRLPSLAAALALGYLLWRAGEVIWPDRGGIVAVAAFGFNLLTPRLATLVRTDMPLTFFITGVGLVVWSHARDERIWNNRSRWLVFGLLLAGMMTKGPVVYAFLLPGMLAAWWFARRRSGNGSALWGGWWHWTLPLVPFLAWTACGIATVPGFYAEVVGKEFLGRFTVGEHAIHHNQPVWFYLFQMLKQWLPWDVLLIAVTVRSPRLWQAACREPGTRWLICWAAGGFLLMSLVPSKRTDRIFPVLPPLALVLVAVLARAQRPEESPVVAADSAPLEIPPATPSPQLLVPVGWPWDWARQTTTIAVVLGLGSVVYYIGEVYYRHDHARSSFAARALRAEAGKTIGLIAGKSPAETDETMLVYLHQLAFLSPAEAIQRWSTGRLDAVVVNETARADYNGLPEPFGPALPALETAGSTPAYVLLVRPVDEKPTAETGPRKPVLHKR